jgi:hypothetical protein
MLVYYRSRRARDPRRPAFDTWAADSWSVPSHASSSSSTPSTPTHTGWRPLRCLYSHSHLDKHYTSAFSRSSRSQRSPRPLVQRRLRSARTSPPRRQSRCRTWSRALRPAVRRRQDPSCAQPPLLVIPVPSSCSSLQPHLVVVSHLSRW